MTTAAPVSCSDPGEDCRTTKCCTTPGFQCYEKNEWWASCMDACDPGEVDPYDGATWTCTVLTATTPTPAPIMTTAAPVSCSDPGEDCRTTKCCTTPGFQCYEKNEWWASCMDACDPGEVDPYDNATWSCTILSATDTPPPTPTMAPGSWVSGTWTTGYWDCCKPSCSWPGKGSVNQSTLSCSADTGAVLSDPNVASVCDGGDAATCASNLPFQVSEDLSMGFAAAAVGGVSGLNGDANCGQCFELVFTSEQHFDGMYSWGGAHPDLVGKRHVVQVTNIGYDVSGVHSFDLMIPGAGQGIFDSGCSRQFSGYSSGDFDCDNNYGGCSERSGCERLPPELRAGCYWRYDWYMWLASSGQTNNPWVNFRRVRCPQQLTAITNSVPLDDDSYPSHTMPTPPPTPPMCEDDDAQAVALATEAGYTISGCADVKSFCKNPVWGSTVQTPCPETCGSCTKEDRRLADGKGVKQKTQELSNSD